MSSLFLKKQITKFYFIQIENLLKNYINLSFSIPEEIFDDAMAIVYCYNALGVEEKLDELLICFDKSDFSDETKTNFIASLCGLNSAVKLISEETLEDKNWNEEWEKSVEPIMVNERIAITPEWKASEIEAPIKLVINPQMSFGTGEHATTRMVARLLETTVTTETKWIDAGCGTGVLAILAIRLGASDVLAFDFDEWSVLNTKENCLRNSIGSEIRVENLDITKCELPECDGIAANLFRHLLLPSFPKFYNSLKNTGGHLIVSGILKYDKTDILNEALNQGFELITELSEDEWIALHLKAVK